MEAKKNTFKKNILWIIECIRLNFLSAISYKESLWIQVFGMFVNNIAFLVCWYFVFKVFGDFGGWSYKELFALNAFASISYGLIFVFLSGLPNLSNNVLNGNIDRFFTQPKNILINVLMGDSKLSAFGDLLFGITGFVIYFVITQTSILYVIPLFALIILSVSIYVGYLLATQSLIFWIPNSVELSEALHHLMLGPALYPNKAFVGIPRILFTFVIPSILISSFPVDILREFSIIDLCLLLIFSFCWVSFGVFVFYKGVRRYESGNLVLSN